jgi:hypothetical protein
MTAGEPRARRGAEATGRATRRVSTDQLALMGADEEAAPEPDLLHVMEADTADDLSDT